MKEEQIIENIREEFATIGLAAHQLRLLLSSMTQGQRQRPGLFQLVPHLHSVESFNRFALLVRSVEELDLSTRSRLCFIAEQIYSLGELIQYSRRELLKIPNLGEVSVNDIETNLTKLGLTLLPDEVDRYSRKPYQGWRYD